MAGVQVKLILFTIFALSGSFGKHIDGMDVRVEKLQDDSNEFKIEYKLDNGEIFQGETLHFHDDAYIFYSANGTMYGISLTSDERNSNSSFYTFARPVQRPDGHLKYTDDNRMFDFDIDNRSIFVNNYLTQYDTNNTCFTKSQNNDTFQFSIESLNNRKILTGEAISEEDIDFVQHFIVDVECNTLLFNFTSNELNSTETFCKAPFDVRPRGCVLGAYTWFDINPKVLISLVG